MRGVPTATENQWRASDGVLLLTPKFGLWLSYHYRINLTGGSRWVALPTLPIVGSPVGPLSEGNQPLTSTPALFREGMGRNSL